MLSKVGFALVGLAVVGLGAAAAPQQADIPFTSSVVDSSPPSSPWYKMTGDINGDGNPDIVVGGSSGPLVWYAYPNWTKTQIASGGYNGVRGETGDVDGDGDVDVVMGGVVWFRNPRIGGGSWTSHSIDNFKAHDAVLGDFDNDGKLDVAARDQSAFGGGGNEIRVYKQNSPTSWTRLIIPCPAGEGLRAADLDGDGDGDIVINGRWFERTGNITTSGGWSEHVYTTSYSHPHTKVEVADVNGDGDPDVILSPAEKAGQTYRISWLEAPPNPRNGGWTEHTIASGVEAVYHALAVGDLEGDGDVDVVTAEMHQGANPDEVIVYQNLGSGGSWRKQVLSTKGSHDVVMADFGNDGDLDIVGANHGGSYQPVEFWRNDSDPGAGGKLDLDSWQRHVIDANKPWRAVFIYPGDIDGDGRADIVTGGWWYRNPGSAGGTWTRNTIGSPLNNVAAIHDFDGDGDLDVLGTEGQGSASNRNFVWARNNGSGGFTILSNIATGGSGDFLQGVAVARFSNGGPIEVALSWHNGGGGVQMLTVPSNPSSGTWSWRQISSTTQSEQLSAGDIDRDGDQDLLLGTIWLRNNGTSWSSHTLFNTGSSPDRNRLADIDGDGRLDAVVGYEAISTTGKLAWYRQPGTATSTWAETVIGNVVGPMSVDVADMDNDGDFDVVVGEHNLSSQSSARIFVFENTDGSGGSWTSHQIYQGDEHHDGAMIADIEGDGDKDVVSIGWGHGRVLLYENTAQSGPSNQAPSVSLTSPANGATFTQGSDISLAASASDPDGSVTKVEFFRNGTKIGEDTSSAGGWTVTWNNVPAGSFTLTARATDNGSATTTSSGVAITVAASTNNPPTVGITAPANGASYTAGDDVTITASASDSDGSVSKVEFFQGAVKLGEDTNGTNGWSFTWNSVLTGNYTLTAVATDDGGASTTSSPISITVAGSGGGTVPSNGLQIWFRADAGITTSGSAVTQWADQSGNGRNASQGTSGNRPLLVAGAVNGLPAVQFDGSNDFLSFTYPVNGLSQMTLVLVSACSQDQTGGGSYAESSPLFWEETASWGTVYLSPYQTNVKFRFGTTQSGNRPSYARPASIGSNYSISIATKNGSTDSLYVNGTLVLSEGGKLSTIAGCVDTGFLGRGHNTTYFPGLISEVLVYDRALTANERQSLEQYLDARYFSAGNTPPTVSITSPAGGATFTEPANITVTASASDPDGSVSQVEFFQGTTSIGTDTDGNNGWSVSWNGVSAGTYSLTAVATDNGGASTTSGPVSITVSAPADTPPSVSITNPANGATVSGTVPVAAQANDPDGGPNDGDGIGNVTFELRQGATVLASSADSSAPFTWNLDTTAYGDGSYTLRAVATSTAGGGTATDTIGITIFNSVSGVPPPWQNRDIGAVGVPGSGSFFLGTFTLTAAGADIWGAADAFHFVHQPLSGDGQIWARVVSLQNTHAWAKAGVMIRESTAPDSVHAMMVLTPGNGLSFQRRLTTGGSSFSTPGGAATAPVWVRLTRSGNTFTAYASADGLTWSLVATETIAMANDVEIGLALTSHDNAVSTTAEFDNVVVDMGTDTDGDGISDAVEVALGYDPFDNDQDANGTLDGLDDWDNDGIDNQTEISQGTFPGTAPAPGGGGGSGGGGNGSSGGCGTTGLEGILILGLLSLRRRRRAG